MAAGYCSIDIKNSVFRSNVNPIDGSSGGYCPTILTVDSNPVTISDTDFFDNQGVFSSGACLGAYEETDLSITFERVNMYDNTGGAGIENYALGPLFVYNSDNLDFSLTDTVIFNNTWNSPDAIQPEGSVLFNTYAAHVTWTSTSGAVESSGLYGNDSGGLIVNANDDLEMTISI